MSLQRLLCGAIQRLRLRPPTPHVGRVGLSHLATNLTTVSRALPALQTLTILIGKTF